MCRGSRATTRVTGSEWGDQELLHQNAKLKTDLLELQASLRDLEQCFVLLSTAHGAAKGTDGDYLAGPLSLKGPPGTVSSIAGVELAPLKVGVASHRETASRVRRCALAVGSPKVFVQKAPCIPLREFA